MFLYVCQELFSILLHGRIWSFIEHFLSHYYGLGATQGEQCVCVCVRLWLAVPVRAQGCVHISVHRSRGVQGQEVGPGPGQDDSFCRVTSPLSL